jgi:phosphoribosylanthranilate isomerase
MTELDYLKRNLTKKERRQIARYMSQYNNMSAIIESKRMDLMPSITSSIKLDAVQETNTNASEADKYLKKSMAIDDLVRAKNKLDEVYKRAKPLHKLIWDEHFIDGRRDSDIYYGEDITKRTYYREKNELMNVVAECLGIGRAV